MDKQLDVYDSLAKNPDLIISASSNENTNLMLMADSVLEKQSGDNSSNGGMLANLNLLRLASNAYGLRSDTYIPEEGARTVGAASETLWAKRT